MSLSFASAQHHGRDALHGKRKGKDERSERARCPNEVETCRLGASAAIGCAANRQEVTALRAAMAAAANEAIAGRVRMFRQSR